MIRRRSRADLRTYEERLAAVFEEPEREDDTPARLTARLAFVIALVTVFIAGATFYIVWMLVALLRLTEAGS